MLVPATYREPLVLKVLPLAVSCPCTTSESTTSTLSLILAHAPDQIPLAISIPLSIGKSLSAAADYESLLEKQAPSDILQSFPALGGIGPLPRSVPSVHLLASS